MADGHRKTLGAAVPALALLAGVALLAPACRRASDRSAAPQLEAAAAVPVGRCGGATDQGWSRRWPPVTNGVEYALAALQDRAFLFGGYTGRDALNVTCEWSRAPSPDSPWRWRDPFPPPSSPPVGPPPEGPSPRGGHVMATLGSAIFMFGGSSGAHHLADTWRFDGAAWSPVPVSGPRPSGRAAAAFVSVGDRLVLFGGRGKGGALGDTWTFDGTAWTEVTPAAGEVIPEPRWGAAMARLGSAAVLYGGVDATGRVLEDTWIFDGRWRPRATVHRPGPLHGHAMSSARDRVALVGGASALPGSPSPYAVTWLFDGHDWTPLVVSPHPPPRIGGVMAPFGSGALLFGGGGLRLDGFLLDTWWFDGDAWQPLLHDVAPTSNVLALANGSGNARVTSKGPVVSECAQGPLTAEAQVYMDGGGLMRARLGIRAGSRLALGVTAGAAPGDGQLRVTVWCEALQSADRAYLRVAEAVVPDDFVNRWHHLACSAGPDERPTLSLDGASKGAAPLRVTYGSPPPDELAIETSETPLAQVDELRLSRGVRYRPPFPRPPRGMRREWDGDTCELWRFDEASGVHVFRATGKRANELRAADGKRAFASVPAWPWPMTVE